MITAEPRAPAAPEILGRYRLEERIAVGGSAEVWKALDLRAGRRVAVKLLHPHLLPDPASHARLTHEARAVAGLSHPGIIQVLDIDPGSKPAIVLELVDGEPLSARLAREGRLPEREAAAIGAGVAEALYHAHLRGVIHRDVKPGNILLDGSGAPRLVDFGIARVLGEAAAHQTQTGMVMGTLRYMAPEQLAGEPVTPRVDLYGLGSVLHEMLTGTPPFPAVSPGALLDQQAAGPPLLRDVDGALADLVRACLQPDPAQRPRHAGVAAAALRSWLAGDPAAAHALKTPAEPIAAEADRTTAATLVPVRSEAPGARPAPSSRTRRRAPVLLVAGTLLLLIVAAGSIGFANLGGATAATQPTVRPTASAAPPGWASALAASYQNSCGPGGPTASELAAMGQAAATDTVSRLIATCTAPPGGAGGGNGTGGGHGKGHGHNN